MADFILIKESLISGNQEEVMKLVEEGINQGLSAKDILNIGLIDGMDTVGQKMESGDLFIPEVLQCARAMATAVEYLKPHLAVDDMSAAGKVVIGTVEGDVHDIGKNLVIMMLESAGFEVFDLGVGVTPETFLKQVQEKKPDILALSALLTTTMKKMQVTIDAIAESGIRESIKVIVGGAPVTQAFADEIGADGYAADAGSASRIAKNLLQ